MRSIIFAVIMTATLGVVPAVSDEAVRGRGFRIDPSIHIDFFQAAGVSFDESSLREMPTEPSSFGGLIIGNHVNLLHLWRFETLGVGWGIIGRDRPVLHVANNSVLEPIATVTLLDLRLATLNNDDGMFTDLHLSSRYFWGPEGTRGWLLGCSIGLDF